MFNPKYRILITSKNFSEDKFICLGSQLASIINSLKCLLPLHVWYGSNVEAVGENAVKYNVRGFQPSLIGNDSQFVEYCLGIEQFIWGDFLCIDSQLPSQNILNVEIETEDAPFRPIDSDGVLLEVRAFDTSYFEIYSEDKNLILKLSQIFKVQIDEN